MRNDWARKLSFQYVPETCNKVDSIFNDLIEELTKYVDPNDLISMQRLADASAERIKSEVTIPFRDGFAECIADNEVAS